MATQYESYIERARNGELRKTQQYWLIYFDLMYLQTMAYSAVQGNGIEKLAYVWYSFFYLSLLGRTQTCLTCRLPCHYVAEYGN